MVVWLSWLSGMALAPQARGFLGLTPGDCQPFSLPLFLLHNIYHMHGTTKYVKIFKDLRQDLAKVLYMNYLETKSPWQA